MRKSALIGSFLHLVLPIASAVSLTDFQKLTVDVTVSCAISYDRTIPSCTVNDFKTGKTCSSGCVSGLNQIANGVLESCGGTVVGSSTLLGRIFSGAIISSLCPNNDQSTSQSQKQSTTAAPATTAKSSTQAPAAKTSSTTSSAAAASSSSSSTSAASSSGSAAVESSTSTATTASSSTTAVAASTASSSTSSSAAAQTSQAQTQPGNGRSGMTVQQQQIAAISKSGGGSPFDIIGYSAASHPSSRDLVAITLGVALLVIGYLMR